MLTVGQTDLADELRKGEEDSILIDPLTWLVLLLLFLWPLVRWRLLRPETLSESVVDSIGT